MSLSQDQLTYAVAGALIVAGKVYGLVGAKKKDQRETVRYREMTQRFEQMEKGVTQQITDARRDAAEDVAKVRWLVEGQDGENGIKSEVRAIQKEQKDEARARHDRNGEWQGALSRIEIGQTEIKGRVEAIEENVRDIKEGRVVLPYDRRMNP